MAKCLGMRKLIINVESCWIAKVVSVSEVLVIQHKRFNMGSQGLLENVSSVVDYSIHFRCIGRVLLKLVAVKNHFECLASIQSVCWKITNGCVLMI